MDIPITVAIGQYVRRINTATIGRVTGIQTDRRVDIQWRTEHTGWNEFGAFLTELIPVDQFGNGLGYFSPYTGKPRTADGEPEKAAPVLEDGPVVSGSPEATESSPDHGSQIHDVSDWEAMRTGTPEQDPKNWEPELLKGESIIWDGGSINREDSQNYTMPPRAEDSDLVRWWVAKAQAEVEPMVAKMAEYGGDGRAIDLINIGREVARLGKWEVNDTEATEIGITYYVLGKISRAMASLAEKRLPSDDTWHDIKIYSTMVQRTREFGGWPK